MAVGDINTSGAFTVADMAAGGNVEIFIEANLGATTNSGAHIFIVPDINVNKFWVGVRRGAQG